MTAVFRTFVARLARRLVHLQVVVLLGLTVGALGCDGDKSSNVEDGREKAERVAEKLKEAGGKLKKAGKKAQEVAADVALPPQQAERLGDRMADEIMARATVVEDHPAAEYIDQLGAKIVDAAGGAGPEAIDYDFHLLRDPAINAFAIPGGHIFVTTGLLKAAESEAEVVAVLGHEVAHVTERHIAERMAAIYGVSVLAQLALGEDSGQLERIAAEVLAEGFLLKHSRDDEREADEVGMRFVIDAGYSPRGFVDFFERISKQERPPELLSTHPNPESRAAAAREAIANLSDQITGRPVHPERLKAVTGEL